MSLFVYLVNIYAHCPSASRTHTVEGSCVTHKESSAISKNYKIGFNSANIFQICILCLGTIVLLWRYFLNLCDHVRYVSYNTNLDIQIITNLFHIPVILFFRGDN